MRFLHLPVLLVALFLAGFAMPAGALIPHPQQRQSRQVIDKLEEAWCQAILKGDVAAMDALLGRDYMAITAEGTLLSREQTLANLKDGTLNFLSVQTFDRKVRFYGATAVATSRAEVRRRAPEGVIAGTYFETRVYVRDAAGKWKIVHFEVNRIREPQDKKIP